MDELLKKLSETGIKTLDLVNQGLDKLPAGISALWEAAVMRAWITGIVSLSLAGVGLIAGFGLIYLMTKIWKKHSYNEEVVFVTILGIGVPTGIIFVFSVITLCSIHFWVMAFAPEQYILSELLLNFTK